MIRISNLKLRPGYGPEDIESAVRKKLGISGGALGEIKIAKRSLDARKKQDIRYVLTVDAEVSCDGRTMKRLLAKEGVCETPEEKYVLPAQGSKKIPGRPYVIGSGPAGLFCAYFLAEHGYRPVLIERGQPVEQRAVSVQKFTENGELNPESNVQFGEGGAGTFSDGKLSYSGKDRTGRGRLVLHTFVRHGAQEEILYDAKPHVGTDRLQKIVKSMRESIIENGGEVLFSTKLVGIKCKYFGTDALESVCGSGQKPADTTEYGRNEEKAVPDGRKQAGLSALAPGKSGAEAQNHGGTIEGIYLQKKGVREPEFIPCQTLVLALGHSARDTFEMLLGSGLKMEPKPFAVGVRVQHTQESINRAQYTPDYKEIYPGLPPADYKLVTHTENGRSVYSFCMCPGGYVINSSSEAGGLCINGMSYSGRNGRNANSAIVVNVTPEDFGGSDVLAGMRFQRELERSAYAACKGKIPTQRLGDFNAGRVSQAPGAVSCEFKGASDFADLNKILPEFVCDAIKEAFPEFGRSISGFDDPDALLSAVEARTSSPVRILRDEDLESNIRGIYPCGEGAGYAGGIMSAAMDGVKVFEQIYKSFRP